MVEIIRKCVGWVYRPFNVVANLAAENIALRHQLIVLNRKQRRPKLKVRDRLFWVVPSENSYYL